MRRFHYRAITHSRRSGLLGLEYLRELGGLASTVLTIVAVLSCVSGQEQEAARKETQLPPIYSLGFVGEPPRLWINRMSGATEEYAWPSDEPLDQLPIACKSLSSVARGGGTSVTTVLADWQGLLTIARGDQIHVRYRTRPIERSIHDVHVTSDGDMILAVTPTGELLRWSWNGTSFDMDVHQPGGSLQRVIAAPDRNRVLLSRDHARLAIWDLDRQEIVNELKPHDGRLSVMDWSPDGAKFATSGEDGYVRLWDAATGAMLWEAVGDSLSASSLTFSRDGSLIAAGGFDQKVRVWNVATGQMSVEFSGHCGPVRALAFAPEGDRIISGGLDGRALAWSLGNQTLERELH